MKIGIISEYSTNTVNYGNNLQAYALNYYLRQKEQVESVDSIVLGDRLKKQYTNIFSIDFCKKVIDRICQKKQSASKKKKDEIWFLSERQKNFEAFQKKYIPTNGYPLMDKDLSDSEYDVFIVGSDVVWAQAPFSIIKAKFLAFASRKDVKRISYAASFGNEFIPKGNQGFICKYLQKFDSISVREHSSVSLLNELGISNVSYCVDPTLLLTQEEWTGIERKPDKYITKPYVFSYLLGNDIDQRKQIMKYAHEKGACVVTIPYAQGQYLPEDDCFGDIQIGDCSIENWLWLIHHAECVFTDSFHGTVFSTIFHKPFVVLERIASIDINNRMQDYLREIRQEDKYLQKVDLTSMNLLVWDYEQIWADIEARRKSSVEFLNNALGVRKNA